MSAAPAAPRAILYLRQSASREDSISLEVQETAGRDHCARHGYIVVGVEQDPGISGRTWKRPAVQRLLASIENGEADVVVLWRWSRLSRSRKDWALAVDRIDVAGGRIESATEPNDVTAAGRFARGVMSELSAFESERIGEQWKEVHTNRVARGLQSGRLPWGWLHENRTATQHPDNAAAIPKLYEMYLAGSGSRQLSAWLEANGYLTYYGSSSWSHSAVTAILDSPFHSGQITYKGDLYPGAHDALVPVATWEKYMAMRRERMGSRAAGHNYLLSGLIHCGCGSIIFGFANHKGHRATNSYYGYRCSAVGTNKLHGSGTVTTKYVDSVVMDWLARVGTMPNPAPDAAAAAAAADVKRLAREIVTIDGQISTLTQHLVQGVVSERAYRSAADALEARRAALSTSLGAVESSVVLAPADPAAIAQGLMEAWPLAPLQTKRATIQSLVASITIDFAAPRTLTITPRWGTPVAVAI